MRTALIVLLALSATAGAQQPIPQPTHAYYNGVVLSDDFRKGALYSPVGKQLTLHREEIDVTADRTAQFMYRNNLITCRTVAADSWCYDDIHLMMGTGPGMINGDYRRVEHAGTGPSIARKTAVRGSPSQWAVWAEQINLGPGAKAALWIGGDNPQLEGLAYHTTDNVIVVNNNLRVNNSVFQWNATPDSAGVFLRVFKGSKLVYEVTSDGIVRARGFQVLP